jgi:metal-responsive CopG/Arc/MetJ family transcriptional regulator
MPRPNLEGTKGDLPIVTVKIPQSMLDRIDVMAREDVTTRSAIIRRALLSMFRDQSAKCEATS